MRLWDFFVEKTYVDKMQKMLYENYKLRTGEEPVRFNILL